jgi:hypothetical protein
MIKSADKTGVWGRDKLRCIAGLGSRSVGMRCTRCTPSASAPALQLRASAGCTHRTGQC